MDPILIHINIVVKLALATRGNIIDYSINRPIIQVDNTREKFDKEGIWNIYLFEV
jgi:hypothetical protein